VDYFTSWFGSPSVATIDSRLPMRENAHCAKPSLGPLLIFLFAASVWRVFLGVMRITVE